MKFVENFKRFVRGEDYDSDEYQEFSDGSDEEQSSSKWSSGASSENVKSSAKTDYYTAPSRDISSASSTPSTPSSSYRETSASQNGKVFNIHTMTQLSVVLVRPEKYESVSDVAEHLKAKRTVVLNLEDTNRDVARRVLDFLSGATYATEGKITKIANSTYIITPHNINLQGDIVEELENNGLYI